MSTKIDAHTIIDSELYDLARKQMEARKLARAAEAEAKGLTKQIEIAMDRYLDLEGSKLEVAGGPLESHLIEVNIVSGTRRHMSKDNLMDTGVTLQQIEDATVETEYTQVRVKYV